MNHSTGHDQYLSSNGTPRWVHSIPIGGSEVRAVAIDGRPRILLTPAMRAIGVDPAIQSERLSSLRGAVYDTGISRVQGGVGEADIACDLRTFLWLLATLDERPSTEPERTMLIVLLTELAEAVRAYWEVHTSSSRPTLSSPEQATVLATLQGVVDSGWLEAKARQLVGRVLSETPEHDEQSKPLTVSTYLSQRGLSDSEIRIVSGPFGKRLKQRFVVEYGVEPPEMEDLVGRHMVPVRQYQERHRPLFDEVWRGFSRPRGASSRPRGRKR